MQKGSPYTPGAFSLFRRAFASIFAALALLPSGRGMPPPLRCFAGRASCSAGSAHEIALRKQRGDPINESIDHACADTIEDHRPGDGEHLRPHAQHIALCLCQDRTHKFFAILEFYDSVQR